MVDITPRDADLFRTIRSQEVSPVSVNIDLRTLKASFSTAVRWKMLPESPFKGTKLLRIPERPPRYFTKEEFEQLVSVIREQWFKEFVIVAVLTGLRRGELINLRWKNVDLGRRMLLVQSSESFQTKAGKMRVVPLNPIVCHILATRSSQASGDFVFTYRGSKVLDNLVTHKFRRYVRAAGLDLGLHFHSLRHTFASWLVQARVSIYEVQKLLGHSNVTVTQIYSHLSPNELQYAVERIPLLDVSLEQNKQIEEEEQQAPSRSQNL